MLPSKYIDDNLGHRSSVVVSVNLLGSITIGHSLYCEVGERLETWIVETYSFKVHSSLMFLFEAGHLRGILRHFPGAANDR